jgi:hypothetical protein
MSKGKDGSTRRGSAGGAEAALKVKKRECRMGKCEHGGSDNRQIKQGENNADTNGESDAGV